MTRLDRDGRFPDRVALSTGGASTKTEQSTDIFTEALPSFVPSHLRETFPFYSAGSTLGRSSILETRVPEFNENEGARALSTLAGHRHKFMF